MKYRTSKYYILGCTVAIIFPLLFIPQVHAHEPATFTDSGVDRVNNTIYSRVLEVQDLLSRLVKQSQTPASWPDPVIYTLREDILHLEEEAGHSLEYFLINGINIQSVEALRSRPLAGRSVAASQAIKTAKALLEHVASLADQESFIKEIYGGGLSSYMYSLLGAHREKMELYAELILVKKKEIR